MPPLTQTAATRSILTPTHLLHTPESFVRTPLPGLTGGLAIVHACPALGARFLMYTAELEPSATLAPCPNQRFLYVLSGTAQLTLEDENYADREPPTHQLRPGSYAYLPPAANARIESQDASRLLLLEKPYESLPYTDPPSLLITHEDEAPQSPLEGAEALQVRTLLPPGPAHDFALNTLTYAPGAALPQVEVHYMEHGLLMLHGEALYLLNQTWYPTQQGDFIWMAPFCPQQCIATAQGCKYLIYKNFNRTP